MEGKEVATVATQRMRRKMRCRDGGFQVRNCVGEVASGGWTEVTEEQELDERSSDWLSVREAGARFAWKSNFKNKAPSMSTPQRFSDARNDSSNASPSIPDFPLQGCSNRSEEAAMFRTAMGNPVRVGQSSIAKALSLLGNDADANGVVPQGEENETDDSCSFSNSLFTTGSGKGVNISSSGMDRAKSLLGLEQHTVGGNFQSPDYTRKSHVIDEAREMQHSSRLQQHEVVNSSKTMDRALSQSPSVDSSHASKNDFKLKVVQPDCYTPLVKEAPIKFHTAGGRSVSVSSGALQRARSLLGNPDLGDFISGGDAGDLILSFPNEAQGNTPSSCLTSDCNTPSVHRITSQGNYTAQSFAYPSCSSVKKEYSTKFLREGTGNNLIMKFDAVVNESEYSTKLSNCEQEPTNSHSLPNGLSSKVNPLGMSSRKPLAVISCNNNILNTSRQPAASDKRRLGSRVAVSPFKRPRISKISVPYDQDVGVSVPKLSELSSEVSGCNRRVSTRYPFRHQRMQVKEFFGVPTFRQKHFLNQVRQVTSFNAEKYMFHDGSTQNSMGAEDFVHLLAQHGASTHFASNDWVKNHYKWIVWKLACYERCCSARPVKFLTVSNVLEELKYRYEREVNHAHRSTIKRILEGDAPPSSMMILCISSIHSDHFTESGNFVEKQTMDQSSEVVKVELTDGWYSVNAVLDVPLSRQLAARRLFVGQKLRIWGARLCGWDGPASPLEVSSSAVSLLLNINGTCRVHWAERLGFCKAAGPPLAFRCIKSNGGLIPQTLAGITRIYPIVYKERLSNGQSVVRSERMENKVMEVYNQRRSAVVESIISEYQKERSGLHTYDDGDSEGARIHNMLETAEEPEFLMADMSPEQLKCFSAYKAKLNAITQSEQEKSTDKALKDAGLSHRDVTPLMRIRVVGLTYKVRQHKRIEGIVTIWNPTEKQCQELVEGESYAISGLTPISGSDLDILRLQTRGSSTKWLPLSSNTKQQFKPFFISRISASLLSFSCISLSSEFDIAAYVVHVGNTYVSNHQKKQWVFVTDASAGNGFRTDNCSNSLLAICFCSPSTDFDSYPPINYNLAGSTVGFCNLIKKERDDKNHILVAEATENSTYYLSFDSPQCSHLRNSASEIKRWANNSSLIIEKLKQKVLLIVGDSRS
ncbi:protein BREAST CANCER SUSCEPTIBILITY 2 homolog A-like [Arachis stenosperma]|uniref:protein BREAST CANCER SUSCEPTIBILITY 2 homolog A-like n=1 Tax=Arachis stenosperma TaxID=217475 RepID=UPI0025ABCB70|nr:protein BREAST CANCER SUSCEPTIBILITY 2 homolog A-like [Arachis stenosperma]